MKLPTIDQLERNLRETLVVKAEELDILAGGDIGTTLVCALTGVTGVDQLPTEWFASDERIERIAIDRLAITRCIHDLHRRLATRSLGMKVGDGWLSCDEIDQETLQPIELYLSSLPDVALAGYDWTSCRNGAIKEFLLLGTAWHRLIDALDNGSHGNFECEPLTVTDVALLAGIDERTLRNKVGKSGPLRSIDHYNERRSPVSQRGFVAINRFDAIDWLLSRRDFRLGDLRPGSLAKRVKRIAEPSVRGKAALVAGMALGQRLEILAAKSDCSIEDVQLLADGKGSTSVADKVSAFVAHFDKTRLFQTAPA